MTAVFASTASCFATTFFLRLEPAFSVANQLAPRVCAENLPAAPGRTRELAGEKAARAKFLQLRPIID